MGKGRKVFLSLGFGIAIASIVYSCGSQQSLAGKSNIKLNTITPNAELIYKPIKQDSIFPKKPTKQQIEFTRKLNYILDNSGKTFDNVSSITASMNNMSEKMDLLHDVVFAKAIELRQANDALISQVNEGNKQQKELLRIALQEAKARRAYELKNDNAVKEVNANQKAQTLYTSIGFGVMIVLLLILLIIWIDIKTIKSKVYQAQNV